MKKIDDIHSPGHKIPNPPADHGRLIEPLRNLSQLPFATIIGISAIALLIVFSLLQLIGIGPSILKPGSNPNQSSGIDEFVRGTTITEDTAIAMDFVFNLYMEINDQPQTIPTNFGKSPTSKSIFHADSATGDIRIQSPEHKEFLVKDFFTLWDAQFNNRCLMNHCLSGQDTLIFRINGQPNTDYQNYTINPGDYIEIIYRQ